ncbi:MAG: M23 family metallopeptidase [Candidatus Binataceae bacterium]|nr:M23 family metallopeptidase [Candidatus Binataceae bacterium]
MNANYWNEADLVIDITDCETRTMISARRPIAAAFHPRSREHRRANFRTTVSALLAPFILFAGLCGPLQNAAAADARPALLAVGVVQNPNPMVAFGNAYLVYELILTSYDSNPIDVTGLRVADADNPRTVFTFSGAKLASMIHRIGATDEASAPTKIESGRTSVVYVWIPFADPSAVPRRLTNDVECRVKRQVDEQYDIRAAPIAVDEAPPISIGPPLRGGDWLAGGGPSNTSYHRRARMVVNGVVYFAQRFAIDYVKISPQGQTYIGDPKKNTSYLCYGADLLAVADGKVVGLKDGLPENTPDPVARAVEMTMETAGGNYVALDIGFHRYALYGHLIPGSLKVKLGDVVKRGQVLARLGNSGNSTEPHLHFQIADAPSFLAAQGLTYVYDEVEVKPSQIVDATVDPPVIRPTGPARRYLATIPLENDLVDFP